MKRQLLAACIATAAVMTAGCQALNPVADKLTTTEATTESETVETTVDESAAEAAAMDLYNGYVEVNNIMTGRMQDVIRSYFKYVSYQEEFSPTDSDYWCLSMISTAYGLLDDTYEMASAKEEKDKVDNDFLALYPVMKELMTALDEVQVYTDLKSYMDDDYAKGRELHARIWTAYNQYESLSVTFLDSLSVVVDRQVEEDLKKLKEEGFEATYALNIMFKTAGEIQTAIGEQGVTDENILDLNLEALQPLYDQYVENVTTSMAYLDNEEQMIDEGYPTNSAYYSSFKRSIIDSKVALTDLFQRVRDQKPFEFYQLNTSFGPDGSIQEFDETVSAMISDYNHFINY